MTEHSHFSSKGDPHGFFENQLLRSSGSRTINFRSWRTMVLTAALLKSMDALEPFF